MLTQWNREKRLSGERNVQGIRVAKVAKFSQTAMCTDRSVKCPGSLISRAQGLAAVEKGPGYSQSKFYHFDIYHLLLKLPRELRVKIQPSPHSQRQSASDHLTIFFMALLQKKMGEKNRANFSSQLFSERKKVFLQPLNLKENSLTKNRIIFK